jgi:aspartyl protease family protein
MEDGSQPRLIYLVLLLVMLVATFLLNSKGRGAEIWRAVRWWMLIFGVAILGAAFWPDVQPRVMAVLDPSSGQMRGKQIVFRKQTDGHFYARAIINDVPITFAIDTGASTIALTRADALKAGFDPAKLTYNQISMTANGQVKLASVRLRSLVIGDRTFSNVAATVLDSDLDVSLMGMSFLSQFGRLTIEGDQLILDEI